MVRKLCASTTLCLLLVLAALAQAPSSQVTARLSSDSIALDETAMLTVAFSGFVDNPDVAAPVTRDGGLQFHSSGRRISMSNINGQTTHSVELDYTITPLRTGRHLIEPVTGTVGGVAFTTTSLRLEVTDIGTGSGGSGGWQPPTHPYASPWMPSRPSTFPFSMPEPQAEDFLIEALLEPEVVYKHQPVFYDLRLLAAARLASDPRYSPINPTGFLRVMFEQENDSEERNGRYYSVSSVKTAYFPLSEGEYTFEPTQISLMGGLFSAPQVLRTAPKTIRVLPLPSQGRPRSFTGAVGQQFEIRARLKSSEITLGGTTELEITVKGDGHLDLVPYPYLPDWSGLEKKQLSSPSVTSAENGSIVSRRTYNFRLKPTQKGHFELSDIALAYFDPVEERYEVHKAPTLLLEVAPNPHAEATTIVGDGELPDHERPRVADGAVGGQLPRLPWLALAAGAGLLLLGLGLSQPAVPRRRGRQERFGRKPCESLAELLAALEELAPGPDSASRQLALQARGWPPEAIAKLEEIKRRAARAMFGGQQQASKALLEELNDELASLPKESKR